MHQMRTAILALDSQKLPIQRNLGDAFAVVCRYFGHTAKPVSSALGMDKKSAVNALDGKAGVPVSAAGVGQPEPLSDGGLYAGNVLAVNDLIAAVEGDGQPQGSVYEARTATEMIVAVFESHRQGGPVAFPLENRQNPLAMLD